MVYAVGDRVRIGDDLCTVRFVGEIHRWPGSTTYGVEWDCSDRGKNSGVLDGIEYFNTTVPYAGSFIRERKWTQQAVPGVSFYQALEKRYGKSSYEINDIYLGNKKVQSFGFNKLAVDNEQFKTLQRISLDHSEINTMTNDLHQANESFSNVTELDLSYNQLSDFKEVCKFLCYLKSLISLDLSGNYFTKGWEHAGPLFFPQVRRLYLSSCRLNLAQLQLVLRLFPSLEFLDVSRNNLREIDHASINLPTKLKELVLSGNDITCIPSSLSRAHIETLNVSHNLIEKASLTQSNTLTHLDLSFNSMKNWAELDVLNKNFPELDSLRINGNPIFESGNDPVAQFYQVLARFNKLSVLNGSLLSLDERKEATFFFVSQVCKGLAQYDRNSDLWHRLCVKIGQEPELRVSKKTWFDSQMLHIRIMREDAGNAINLTTFSFYSVRNLKRIICEKLKLNILEVTLSYTVAPAVRGEVTQEFCPLSDLNMHNGDTIYVKQITMPKS